MHHGLAVDNRDKSDNNRRIHLPPGFPILRSIISAPSARYRLLWSFHRLSIPTLVQHIFYGTSQVIRQQQRLKYNPSRYKFRNLGRSSIFGTMGESWRQTLHLMRRSNRRIFPPVQIKPASQLVAWVKAVSKRVVSIIIESVLRLRRSRACMLCTEVKELAMAYTLKLDTHLRDLTSEIERISEWHTTGGGFAVLHIAHWRNNGGVAKVGIKVIKVPVQYGRSAKIIADKRLRKEILVWSHLEHPNVLPLLGITYGFGAAGTYGMVCPWIDNGDLSHYLKLHNTLILSERLIMLRQIADAIYYLHSNLVIHGDLTGNNILVAEDGHMLLCDFGLSSLNEDYSDTIYQTSSSPKYNLPWAAPEIVLSEFPLRPSQSTDVYSFGSVIYQVLTGTRPYIGMAEGMICLLLNDRGFPPRPESGFVSDELWALMLRCWKRNPGERPTSIDIRKFLYSMPA